MKHPYTVSEDTMERIVVGVKIRFDFRKYVWIFAIGCYVGYAIETIWCLVRNGYIESRRSLVLGHLSVAYGMGAVLLTLILVRFQNASGWKIFLVSFLSGSVTEYICSLGQEICFGSVAWDYSDLPLNINGRVCLLYSLFWGVIGLGWVKLIMPLLNKLFDKIHIPFERVLVTAFLVFFIFDALLSAAAAVRMDRREAGIQPTNRIELFLDTHFDDDTMKKIYANSKSVD